MSEDASDRRGFFRQFLKRVVDPAAAYAEKHLPQPGAHLRPPGALPASAFQDTCRRCGQCAEVCPADAIKHHTDGTPYIDPVDQPCVACDGLRCMAACPSGALQPTPLEQIRIGLASVSSEICVRHRGDDCRVCLDNCPLGDKALILNDAGAVVVLTDGCIGCGVCEWTCPTSPEAIAVQPL